jgi:hypothetical protein
VLTRPHLSEPVSTRSVARKVSRYAARETVICSSGPELDLTAWPLFFQIPSQARGACGRSSTMPGKSRYLVAFLVACAAVGATVVLARPAGGTKETVKTVPADVKGVDKETEADAQDARMEGKLLGATDADWNAAHTMDDQYEAGVAYDPTPGLSNGATDRFSSVIHSKGHVTSFYLAFPPNTSISSQPQGHR